MRMRFTVEDERAFTTRRDDLGERFERWSAERERSGEPADAQLLLDWKFAFGDGALDVWTVEDAREFLLGWCPRKLSAAPEDCAEIPGSVAAFVEFLADTGLLAGESDAPGAIRRFCVASTEQFLREMADPANFGMAKALLGGLDLDQDGFPAELLDDGEDGEAPVFGPVRLPGEQERLDAVRAAPVLRRLRLLADFCAPPGRQLTGNGNLRLADARHLVDALDTGDDLELGGYGTLRSATELPALDDLLRLALDAGAVRRQKGRLVAVGRFAGLDDVTAYERVIRTVLEAGLIDGFTGSPLLRSVFEGCGFAVLAELLGAGPAGVQVGELASMTAEILGAGFAGLVDDVGPQFVESTLERFSDLGMVAVAEGQVTLTAAAIPVVVELLRADGAEVVIRADPATCDAAAIVDQLGVADEPEWTADVTAWAAHRPDRAAAVDELVGEVCREDRHPVVVVAGLGVLADVFGAEAVAAAHRRLGGPHDGLVLFWLVERSEIDPSTVDPARLSMGLIDLLTVSLDTGGPDALIAMFGDLEPAGQLEVLRNIWRLDHPRLPEVLDVIGDEHPDKLVRKAARKATMQLRSRRG